MHSWEECRRDAAGRAWPHGVGPVVNPILSQHTHTTSTHADTTHTRRHHTTHTTRLTLTQSQVNTHTPSTHAHDTHTQTTHNTHIIRIVGNSVVEPLEAAHGPTPLHLYKTSQVNHIIYIYIHSYIYMTSHTQTSHTRRQHTGLRG